MLATCHAVITSFQGKLLTATAPDFGICQGRVAVGVECLDPGKSCPVCEAGGSAVRMFKTYCEARVCSANIAVGDTGKESRSLC